MSNELTYNDRNLLEAIETGNIEAAQKALKGNLFLKGADIHLFHHRSLIGWALHYRQYKMVRFLLEQGAKPEQSEQPVMDALKLGQPDLVEPLLKGGANPNEAGFRHSAVSVATALGDVKTLRLLDSYQADFENNECLKKSLFECVILGSDWLPPDNESGKKKIDEKINLQNQTEVIKFLIEKGIDVNKPDDFGYTPLIIAVYSDKPALAEILIEQGANVNIQTHKGISPLMFATLKENYQSVQLLLRQGSDVGLKNTDGDTAVIMAARKQNYQIVADLIKHNADFVECNAQGKSAYDYIREENPNVADRFKSQFYEQRYIRIVKNGNGNELYELSQQNGAFLHYLIVSGMIVDAAKKMSYSQTKDIYDKTGRQMIQVVRRRVENIIRSKR